MPNPGPRSNSTATVAALAYGGIVSALMLTLMVPLIARLPEILRTTPSDASWAITVTLLSAAVSTPIAGKLGDMYGKRKIILVLTLPMIAGSILCALAVSAAPIIAGRGLQGLGIGIIPLGVSLLRDVLPPERLHAGIAFMSASMGVGASLGLPFAAAIAEYSDWRLLFWVSAVMAALAAVLVTAVVPSDATENSQRAGFDFLGALGLSVALVLILLLISKGSDWGWNSPFVLALAAAIVLTLVLWSWWELRTQNPLLDLRVTARPPVLWTNVATLLIGFSMYAQSLVVPQIFQLPTGTGYGLGQSMLTMGLWMAPAGLFVMVLSPLGAAITSRFGAKITLSTGSLIVALGYGAAQFLLGSIAGLVIVTMVCASGIGLAYGAMPALIMAAVPQKETASANSFNSVMRSFGSAIAAAVMGSVLVGLNRDFGGLAVPTLDGFRIAFGIGAVVAILGAIVAATIPRPSKALEERGRLEVQLQDCPG